MGKTRGRMGLIIGEWGEYSGGLTHKKLSSLPTPSDLLLFGQKLHYPTASFPLCCFLPKQSLEPMFYQCAGKANFIN